MKISIQRAELEKALSKVQNAVSHKITLPILANFLLEAENDQIKLTATDLELGMSAKAKAKVQEPGSITIPAKKFVDMVREFPESEIHITNKKNHVISIECEKSCFKLMGLAPDEFPKFPKLDEKNTIVTEQFLIKTLLRLTSFSMSSDETRFVLNGILLHINGKTMEMVATDGRRLAYARKTLKESIGFEKSVILPKKTVLELSKGLKDEGEIHIVIGDNQILFTFDDLVVLSRLIEGEFPNYEQVIPNESKEKVKVNRDQFLFATKRANLLTSQESQSVKMEFFKDKVILSKSSPEWGDMREEVEIVNEGKDLTIGFNPQYLLDVLKQLPDQEVAIELTAADKPGIIRTVDQYTYVVLPMQITV